MKYLLDTNVVSELRSRSRRNLNVKNWYDKHEKNGVAISTVTINEIWYGIRLEKFHNNEELALLLAKWFEEKIYTEKIFTHFPVTASIAKLAADWHYEYKIPNDDALIAATAEVNRLVVVTRNVKHFAPTGVSLVNPWEFQG